MAKLKDLHNSWMDDTEYASAYAGLECEFSVVEALLEARSAAGLTQAELARRMGITQSVVARLESGRVKPSTKTLERIAEATGTRLRVWFEKEGA